MFTLGRKIDLRYKSNLIIVLFVLLVTVVGGLFTDQIFSGISLGVGVFLTWALSRELDPAHDYSAFIATGLSLFMFVNINSIQILPVFWLLLLLRAVNGITGKEPTLLDIISLLGFTIFLSLNNENSIYLLLFVIAMVFNRLTIGRNKVITVAGTLSLVLFVVQSYFVNLLQLNNIKEFNTLNMLVILSSALAPILFHFLSRFEIEDDKGNKATGSKIFASQLLYSITVLLFSFFSNISFSEQIIYVSVIIGLAFYFIGIKLFLHKPT